MSQKDTAQLVSGDASSEGLNELITITDPETLQQYGWKPPLPSYVTASRKLWDLWLKQATRAT